MVNVADIAKVVNIANEVGTGEDSVTVNLWGEAELTTFDMLGAAKGFKMAHLNVRSIIKEMDQIKLQLLNSSIDIFTISETWLKPHLQTQLVELDGFKVYRLDRCTKTLKKGMKRGGGLLTYVHNKHSTYCEPLTALDKSDKNIEVQWVLLHRPHCKDVVTCNIYRPPNGDLQKALVYFEECISSLNMSKVNVFILGDMNVNYTNKSAPSYKKLNFFNQSNGLTQHINTTTRNTDKTKSLIDLALTNSKFVSHVGTLEHFISDHQPIFIIHKKNRDVRQKVEFEGRSYRNFDKQVFRDMLLENSWDELYSCDSPDQAWSLILERIKSCLNRICPLRKFRIKNYKPDWMTKELIEQIKDRDYFYQKAKSRGDEDSWNIAKHLIFSIK